MPNVSRVHASRALAAAALVGVAITLTACVSDSSGTAFGAPPASPTPSLAVPTPVPTLPAISRNQPAAIVDGTPISGADYATAVSQEEKAVAQQLQQQPGTTPPTEQQLRSFALNGLIDQAVVRLYARRHGITATPAAVQAQFNQFVVQYGGLITLTNTLKNFGLTVASFKVQLADRIVRDKVEQRVAPMPAAVEEVDARHILVSSRALADKIYAELIRAPGKFAALARKYSIDKQSAVSGGELGFFRRGVMTPSFERAAFSQRVGQIGRPVKSPFGYHIIQVEAHKNVPLAQLDQQTQQLLSQRQQAAFQQWLTAERKRDHVRILAKGVTAL